MSADDPRHAEAPEHPVMLPWHAAGTLDPWTARQIEEHVQGCADCRLELQALRSVGATLQRHGMTDHVAIDDLVRFAGFGAGGADSGGEAVGRHIDRCATCREELEALRAARHRSGTADRGAELRDVGRVASPAAVRWRSAFLVAAALALALAVPVFRGLLPRAPSEALREVSPVRLLAQTRGVNDASEISGEGPWAIEVVLPFGAPAGTYDVSLTPVATKDAPGPTVRTRANQDGVLHIFLTSLPGPGEYRVRAASTDPAGPSYDYAITRVAARPNGVQPPR